MVEILTNNPSDVIGYEVVWNDKGKDKVFKVTGFIPSTNEENPNKFVLEYKEGRNKLTTFILTDKQFRRVQLDPTILVEPIPENELRGWKEQPFIKNNKKPIKKYK